MINVAAYSDFDAASRAVLEFLHQRLGFSLWMMTRVEKDDWVVLQAEDHGYNIKDGAVFRWTDSFCSRMVEGHGPRVAPQAQLVRCYAAAPIGSQVQIGAYIGVPVIKSDGSLFGTLCAIDPNMQNESIKDELPLVELLANLLGCILERDLKSITQFRELEVAREEASYDGLTGLLNRRGWDSQVAMEETRAKRYGVPVSIFILDLDDLKKINDAKGHAEGDKLLCDMSRCLRSTLRSSDIVARVGGDEFAVLAVDCGKIGARALSAKLTRALAAQHFNVSIGYATRSPENGVYHAIDEADRKMYLAKAERKTAAEGVS